jgi:hypothetical protein
MLSLLCGCILPSPSLVRSLGRCSVDTFSCCNDALTTAFDDSGVLPTSLLPCRMMPPLLLAALQSMGEHHIQLKNNVLRVIIKSIFVEESACHHGISENEMIYHMHNCFES